MTTVAEALEEGTATEVRSTLLVGGVYAVVATVKGIEYKGEGATVEAGLGEALRAAGRGVKAPAAKKRAKKAAKESPARAAATTPPAGEPSTESETRATAAR